jgi:hypothetical protein
MKKVKVYLDTQDFANLSKENLSADLISVRSFLIEATSNGTVLIGYSFPLMFELIRDADEKHKSDRLRKARFIKLLCGRNAHPYPTDLKSGRTFPNGGIWTPAEALSGITTDWLKAKLRKGMHEKLEQVEGLNRSQRRKVNSARGSSELFRSVTLGPFSKGDFQDIPIPESFLRDRVFERYLRGQISAHSVISALKQWTIDPESLFELWYEYSQLENPIEKIVAKNFSSFEEGIINLRIAYQNYLNARSLVKKTQRELRKTSANFMSEMNSLHSNSTELGDMEEDMYAEIDNLSDEYFGVGRGAIFRNYLSSMVGSDVKPKPSDLVDLLHFLYINDVDLFRCDRSMAHHIGRQESRFKHKIVASLLDLPDRIMALQTSR